MPADARLATHLARLDGDAVKTFHAANVPPQRGRAMRPHMGLEAAFASAAVSKESSCHRVAAGALPRRIQSLKTTVE